MAKILANSLADALRRQGPELDRSRWYGNLADEVNVSVSTVNNWANAQHGVDTDDLFALFNHFGLAFANEVMAPLGYRLVRLDDAEGASLANLEAGLRMLLDEIQRAKTPGRKLEAVE